MQLLPVTPQLLRRLATESGDAHRSGQRQRETLQRAQCFAGLARALDESESGAGQVTAR
jgi:hypothetical protein